MAMDLTISSFTNGGGIPKQHTCDGANVSPALKWGKSPAGTKAICLIMDDPDAPRGTWVHWVLYNLPPETVSLAENTPKTPTLPNGAQQGINDFPGVGYDGPCPPPGPAHRYYFKIYALDAKMELPARATKKQLEEAMKGHILDKGEWMGKYGR